MQRNTGPIRYEGLVTFTTPRPHAAPTDESVIDVLAETLEEPGRVAATTQKEVLITVTPPAPPITPTDFLFGEPDKANTTLIAPPQWNPMNDFTHPLRRTYGMPAIRPFEESEARREKQRAERRTELGTLAIAVRHYRGTKNPEQEAVTQVGAALDTALRVTMPDIIDELGELGLLTFKPVLATGYRGAVELTEPIEITFNKEPALLNVVYIAPDSLPMFIVQFQKPLKAGQDTLAVIAGNADQQKTLSLTLYTTNPNPDLTVEYINDETHQEIDPERMRTMSGVTFQIAHQLTEIINRVE